MKRALIPMLAALSISVTGITASAADLSSDSETIFDWAEQTFPQFFPPPGSQTLFLDPWLYRYYPSTDIYTGVNTSREVWVAGDVFGGLVYIGTVDELIATITPTQPPMDGGDDTPWIGNWVLVNFLTDEDDGIWDDFDDTTGIGMTAVISETKWVEKNDDDGCEFIYSYSVDSELTYTKTFEGSTCPVTVPYYWFDEYGHLEFSNGDRSMFEYFDDLDPGDDLFAFKWLRN